MRFRFVNIDWNPALLTTLTQKTKKNATKTYSNEFSFEEFSPKLNVVNERFHGGAISGKFLFILKFFLKSMRKQKDHLHNCPKICPLTNGLYFEKTLYVWKVWEG